MGALAAQTKGLAAGMKALAARGFPAGVPLRTGLAG